MTRKKKLKTTNDVEVRYSNWMAQLITLMMPWSLYWVAGRASSKTVQVLSERVQEVVHDCPGAPFAWVADTYSDLRKNIIRRSSTAFPCWAGRWVFIMLSTRNHHRLGATACTMLTLSGRIP